MFAFTRKDVDARVVGNALVVSFQGVDLQKTWRADMGAVTTSSLEVKEDGKKFSVVMRKGEAEETIASFSDRESAAYALSAITGALLKGDTHVVAAQGGAAMAVVSKLFKAAVVVFLLIVLFAYVGPAILGPGGMGILAKQERASRGGGGGFGAEMQPGEAIPADQLFGGNKK